MTFRLRLRIYISILMFLNIGIIIPIAAELLHKNVYTIYPYIWGGNVILFGITCVFIAETFRRYEQHKRRR